MTLQSFIDVLRRPLAELPHELEMEPLPGPFDATVRPPGSKSITNRVLLLAALADGESEIHGALLDADDARVMIEALRTLGARVEIGEEEAGEKDGPVVRITGVGGRFKGHCTLNLKNAGTATRFLTAAACLADGPVVIDGNERMRQRPIGELVAMLRSLGVRVEELGAPGCVPLRVLSGRFTAPEIEVGATQSSQFVSALMLVAPLMQAGLTVRFGRSVTSPSYIRMSLRLLADVCNIDAKESIAGQSGHGTLASVRVPNAPLKGFRYEVEPDASGMTYFWGAAAIVPGASARCPRLTSASVQGDAEFINLLMPPGNAAVTGSSEPRLADADLTNMPDAAMTLAAVACFATRSSTTTITGLRTLRVKETDRLAAIRNELCKLGAGVEIFQIPDPTSGGPADEGVRITTPIGGLDCSPGVPRVAFDTYDDHRMAMSLALIGLRRPNVVIRDPRCVAKTYPTFWRDLSRLYESAARSGEHIGPA